MQVYMGCILQTKKRYVGNMFEDASQSMGVLDTKGIESVRRDSCPAVAKVLSRALTTLFETRNLSAVRAFCQRQFTRILANRISVQDFMFAREVRLGSYRAATVPPAALVAAKCMAQDPRMEPARGERVRFHDVAIDYRGLLLTSPSAKHMHLRECWIQCAHKHQPCEQRGCPAAAAVT